MESIPMLGRGGELAELRRAWERIRSGPSPGPIVATVTGPSGIGKSRLVAAAIAEMPGASVHVGAARLHSPAPYDWLAAILTHCGGDEQWEISVPADALAWLRQDVGVVRERYAPEALLRIAVRVVRALVGDGPAVLVVEDLHALDPASLNLLATLATTPLPALLLVTSLPPETQMVAATLSRLHGSPGAVRQHLAPLDREDVAAALVAAYGDAGRGAIEPVWQRTGGNPYELAEL
ncbi:MAG TPA: ATP-binding protein, partial [Micromonosporaceae bacterium]